MGTICIDSFLFSECVWELYHLDCCQAISVLLEHDYSSRITGLNCDCLLFVVVEFDIPWDSAQVLNFGDTFRAWEDGDFAKAINALRMSIPFAEYAVVVSKSYCMLVT